MTVPDRLKHIPDFFDRLCLNKDVNQNITIYEGIVSLRYNESNDLTEFNLSNGKILLLWTPYPHLKLLVQSSDQELSKILINSKDISTFELFVKNDLFGSVTINKVQFKTCQLRVNFEWFIEERPIKENNKLVKRVEFSVTNFPFKYGDKTKQRQKDGIKYMSNRFIFPISSKTDIIIDTRQDIKKIIDKLENSLTTCITHHGHIEFDSETSLTETLNILSTLKQCLSFFSGNHIGILFVEIKYQNEKIDSWITLHSNSRTYRNILKLGPLELKKSISGTRFIENIHLIRNENIEVANALSYLIHWYIEANCGQGHVEGSLVIAQMAIELLWNLLSQKYNISDGIGKSKGKTSGKIQGLIDSIGISFSNGSFINEIQEFLDFCKCEDYPVHQAITDLRNKFVHPFNELHKETEKKRPPVPDKYSFVAREILLSLIDKFVLIFGNYENERYYYNRLNGEDEPFPLYKYIKNLPSKPNV